MTRRPASTHSCEVLVVGLGPAGGAAAAAAASRGLKVMAVERKREIGVPVQCAEFIPLPLARHARAPGVLAQRVNGMRSVLPSGAAHASPLAGLMVERAAFDQALAGEAEGAGAALHRASRLAALDGERRVARIATPRGALEVAYRALIAADGPHSTVAALLGLPALATVNTRQYTVPLAKPESETAIWLSDAYPGGYAWLFPKGGRANLGVGMDPRLDADMKTPLDALHRHLVAERRVGPEVLFATGGAIPVGGLRERLVIGAVMFAGDAAGLTHPVTGAGIAAAVISGERAAEAAHALVCEDKAGAFAEYEEDIRDQFQASIERGLGRRRELERAWRSAEASRDAIQRRGWIAFEEYYREPSAAREQGALKHPLGAADPRR